MADAGNAYPSPAESLPRSLFGKPNRRSYRAAVKRIVLDLQAQRGMSSLELADLIGCHKDTIDNAIDEACDLSVLILLHIAYAFGEEAIEPVRSLYLCAPVEQPTPDTRLNRIEREINALRKEIGE